MKLLSYGLDHRMEPRLAFALNGYVVDVMRAALWMKTQRGAREFLSLPATMQHALEDWPATLQLLQALQESFQELELDRLRAYDRAVALPEDAVAWFAPVPQPPALRFFQSFSDQPLHFRFGQTQTLLGHQQDLTHAGLEPRVAMAAVLAVAPNSSQAEIAGYCILTHWINRKSNNPGLQLGTATTLGPCLVTADELDHLRLGKNTL